MDKSVVDGDAGPWRQCVCYSDVQRRHAAAHVALVANPGAETRAAVAQTFAERVRSWESSILLSGRIW